MLGGNDLPPVIYVAGHSQGADHLARMAAIASRSVVDVSPFVLTTADSTPAPQHSGIPIEYFPQPQWLNTTNAEWDALISRRLERLVERVQPVLVAVDDDRLGSAVARTVAGQIETVQIVAGRRAEDGPMVDHVIESMELMPPMNESEDDTTHHLVKPVLPVEASDMASRAAARHVLGIPPEQPAVLVDVGRTPDVGDLARVRDALRTRLPAVVPFVPVSLAGVDGVVSRPVPSFERYLHGFDAAVSCAWYLKFHEIVASGTPAVFVTDQSCDDDGQALRGKLAASSDVGMYVDDIWSPDFEAAIRDVLDPAVARRMRTASVHAHPGSGTADAARIIAALAIEDPARDLP